MRKALISVGIVLLAALGFFVWRNASIERLRAEFRPWMVRLERWRDANESVRRALRSPEATGQDPSGIAELRAWAWSGLERIAYVDYRVEKPRHEIGGKQVDNTIGSVTFTVGGFRSDGVRVERAALATVSRFDETHANTALPSQHAAAARLEKPLWERVEPSPRFRNVTAEAGLGAPRRDPPLDKVNHLVADLWPGSGVAVLDFDRDGAEDLFVGDGVRSILYKGDGAGRFADVTETAGWQTQRRRASRRRASRPGTWTATASPTSLVTNAFGTARLFRNRGDGTFEETTAASGIAVPANARSAAFADVDADGDLDLFVAVTGDYYSQMPDPAFDAKDGRANFLYLNDGKGRFTDATKAWGLDGETRWTLSALFQDYDQDGREDVMATNDFGLKNLYRNAGGRFEDVARRPARSRAPTACRARGRTTTATGGPTSTRPARTRSGTSSTSTRRFP